MLELAVKGNKTYWTWMLALMGVIGGAFILYLGQLQLGLGITGMSRDVSWGFYIANFTYMVGVAAGGVMVVLPYYLHNYKAYGKITVMGEFLAIASVVVCLLLVVVDLGQPQRILNVWLYPTPHSVLFWDTIVLNGYLFLNILVGWNALEAERNGTHYQKWLKPFIYISIPWAVSIHTVTAYLYSGLPGRHFWLTAILAPRFLASAFAAGPSLLILLCLFVRNTTKFDPGKEQIQSLGKTVAYAICVNVFFFLCEVFVASYSNIPGHLHSLQYLFFGIEGHNQMVPWMWSSMFLMLLGIILTVNPATRKNEVTLAAACVFIIAGTWIDKALGMISGGFVPNPLHEVSEYTPSLPEIGITIGVYAIGALVLTVLYKIVIGVKEEVKA
ncbi:MAG: polysulfide reductase NrfD [Desulfobacteraceae bacterium]